MKPTIKPLNFEQVNAGWVTKLNPFTSNLNTAKKLGLIFSQGFSISQMLQKRLNEAYITTFFEALLKTIGHNFSQNKLLDKNRQKDA